MRKATISRNTAETKINLTLNLDGELSDAKEVTLEMVHHGLNVLAPQGKESV